jgi:hypothetical protein
MGRSATHSAVPLGQDVSRLSQPRKKRTSVGWNACELCCADRVHHFGNIGDVALRQSPFLREPKSDLQYVAPR